MKIFSCKDALNVVKPEGLRVTYFLFDEYEVHFNEQPPDSTQTWHHHGKVWETIFIIEGELTAKWKEGNKIRSQVVKAGDLIESENTPHTFSNHTKKIVKFLVLKQVLKGRNYRGLLKKDKVVDE